MIYLKGIRELRRYIFINQDLLEVNDIITMMYLSVHISMRFLFRTIDIFFLNISMFYFYCDFQVYASLMMFQICKENYCNDKSPIT